MSREHAPQPGEETESLSFWDHPDVQRFFEVRGVDEQDRQWLESLLAFSPSEIVEWTHNYVFFPEDDEKTKKTLARLQGSVAGQIEQEQLKNSPNERFLNTLKRRADCFAIARDVVKRYDAATAKHLFGLLERIDHRETGQ